MSSLEYSSARYDELPLEIVLNIFSYLEYSDLLAAGSTCSRWHSALDQPEFKARTRVCFSKVLLSDQQSPAVDLLRCERRFNHFMLEDVTLGQVRELLKFIGQTAQSLALDNVDLNDKQFYGMLGVLPHLHSLSLKRCLPLFMSGSFLESYTNSCSNLNELANNLAGLRELALCDNQYLTDAILMRLTSFMPRLKVINMSGCQIAFHNALQRRFYPNANASDSLLPSESVLTFNFILTILNLQRRTLRELDFSHTLIGQSLLSLCDLDLQLQRLYLGGCRQLNAMTVKTFLATQPLLTALDLSATTCVTDDNLACIAQTNSQLEHLKINGCTGVTNAGAIHLHKLRRLKSLDLSSCDGITSDGITGGVASEENHVLLELNVSHLQICEECIKSIASNLRSLRSLHLNNCVNGVTDEAIQFVIGQLRWLRDLSLEHCSGLTDAALTGLNISKLELSRKQSGSQASTMENFYPPYSHSLGERDSSLQSIKISLRSKAEDEIVRDARRKQVMLAAYEMNLIHKEDFEGHNIQQLRGLRSLNLRGCNRISDVSLKYGLKHVELRRLLLSNCQQISLLGMEALVNSCPSIEELDLSDCYNITDRTMQVVTGKLPRLRALHISGCSQLTEHTLDAIIVNCTGLQTLSVYRCRSMYADIEERLSGVHTLRNLNMDNMTSIDNADFFRLKKRLDY
ncbi:SCF E3 ubiquitin ligase complex F-box protein pof2 [Drosophila miranda]|uniref:SCF E3 ubiquitin ligase complex F-box protein pof2 n=1 Tax=Drosophila miranda TaxID=7229 RepID=UPI0007E72820|nr:SCF E3 ubiquitin ligase complex F-box protein pof2 [Drosophila miranda]